MNKAVIGFFLTSVLILLLGCVSHVAIGQALQDQDVVQYQVPNGVNTIDFALAANPTTGYTWVVAKQSSHLDVSLNYQPSIAQPIQGAGGVDHVFVRFLPGFQKGTLVLAYVRPWEKGGVVKTKMIEFYR